MSGSYPTVLNRLGHPREPSCYNPGYEKNGFLSFLWKFRWMLFHSFHSRTISIISINPGGWCFAGGTPGTHQIFHFFYPSCVFHFFQDVGSCISFISFVFFISLGCRIWYFFHFFSFFCVFHFFQDAGYLISFISFGFLSGCEILYFFHFFQGKGYLLL